MLHPAVRWSGRMACVVLALAASVVSAQERLMSRQFTNGTAVRSAFRQVVAEASRSAVRLKVGDKSVALGTIVSPDGYVLTKASELTGEVTCHLRDGSEHPARIVGVHDDTDLALLKVDAEGLPAVAWSEDEPPSVGRWLASVGIGDLPVAVGVVSVPARQIPAERGILGIVVAESGDDAPGVRITRVFPNSGAAKAGLEVGDRILEVAGDAIGDGDGLTASLSKFRPGEVLTLQVRRGEDELRVEATLGGALSDLLDRNHLQNRMGGDLSLRRNGFPAALQHDTVLRPRDCGGAVVDLSGRAVGVNIARAGRTETYTLPAVTVRGLVEDLKAGKFPPRPSPASGSQLAEGRPAVSQGPAE